MKYCRRLSEAEHIPEEEMCYPAVEEIGDNYIPDFRRASRTGYRLLTNAEWEYACRAGSSTPRFYGFEPSLLENYAWYVSNSGGTAHPVGMLKPNRFGLFDVYGNVREWTIYPTALMTKTSTGLGGSYAVSERMLRSANWRADPISYRGLQNGFRIGRTWKDLPRQD
jgi:formylglycine-generating enzyme required for sulfatase activity